MTGMNGVMPYQNSMMVADLHQRAARETSRIRQVETMQPHVSLINTDIPPRELGLYSQLTMVLESAQVDARAAARSYAQQR